jgi:phytoene synthase
VYAEQLIDGVARDLTTARYATFDDLAAYCYGAASTVGLLSMHIIGFAGREAILYAVKLGVALQLTNILRDVREDWDAGRVYLPQDELAESGVSDADIGALSRSGFRGEDGVADRWRAFMRFQIDRNRQLYSEATPGIAWLDPAGRFAIAAAAALYRDILESIAAHDGDVFSRRAKPRPWTALPRAAGLWWRTQRPPAPQRAAVVSNSGARAIDLGAIERG